MSTSWTQPAGGQFVTSSMKPISEVTANCLISEYSATKPSVFSYWLFPSEPCATSGCLMRVMKDISTQSMKTCDSVPSWKHFSCQNVKAGNSFNINLCLHLSLTFSVAVRNGFDAVQICPISSLSPSQMYQPGPDSVSSLLSIIFEQSMCLSLFLPIPLPWHQLPASEDWPQDVTSSSASSPLSLSPSLSHPWMVLWHHDWPQRDPTCFYAGLCFCFLRKGPRQTSLLENGPFSCSDPTGFATQIFPLFSGIFDPGLAARGRWRSRTDHCSQSLLYHGPSGPHKVNVMSLLPWGHGTLHQQDLLGTGTLIN